MARAAYNERFDLMLSAFVNGYAIGAAVGAVAGGLGESTAKALGFDTVLSPIASYAAPLFAVLGTVGGGAAAGLFGSVNLNTKSLGLNAPSFLLVTTDPDKVDSAGSHGPPSPIP